VKPSTDPSWVRGQPVKDAGDGSSRDVFHEDGNHVAKQRGAQKAHDVGVSEGFEQLHFPLQMAVLFLRGVGVGGIEAHLLRGDQLAPAGQDAVHLLRMQRRSPGLAGAPAAVPIML